MDAHLTVNYKSFQNFHQLYAIFGMISHLSLSLSFLLFRFVIVGARDPERTTASKLAHLMSRVEALACAPPGALLVCLQLHVNSWKIMADVYPEERLASAIQEQVAAGFIPLVQVTA